VDVNDAAHTNHDFVWGIHNFQITEDQAGICYMLGHTTWEEMFGEIMKFHWRKLNHHAINWLAENWMV
jgi:hypothetical protein